MFLEGCLANCSCSVGYCLTVRSLTHSSTHPPIHPSIRSRINQEHTHQEHPVP